MTASGSAASATIRSFSAARHRRRRSRPVMISITPSIAHLNHTLTQRLKAVSRSLPDGRQRRDTYNTQAPSFDFYAPELRGVARRERLDHCEPATLENRSGVFPTVLRVALLAALLTPVIAALIA